MRVKVIRPKHLHVAKGTLLISNHQSKSDPFFVGRMIGLRNTMQNYPICFPTTHQFMEMPIVKYFLWSLYCFTVGESMFDRAKALIKIRELLNKGKTVLLFPEGRRIREGNHVEEFHRGLDMLLRENHPILLVRIKNFNSWSLFRLGHKNQPTIEYREIPKGYCLEEKRKFIREFYGT
jgi:1-acyl-sn-glycerol-3-phosphate acyltransferase